MKSWMMPLALVVLAAGCKGTAKQKDLNKTNAMVGDLRLEMVNKNALQSHLYDGLVSANEGVLKRIVALESQAQILRAELDQVRMELRTAKLAVTASTEGKSHNATTPQKPPRTFGDIILETEAALSNMRSGRLRLDEVARQLKPWARETAPYLVAEIRKYVADIKYQAQIELILGSFPPAELLVPLTEALGEPGSRYSVPRIVGATGDPDLSSILAPHATAQDENFRLAVGEALVNCRNATGILALVSCLKSDDRSTRFISITALKALTNGRDFGYLPGRDRVENAAALKMWNEWAADVGKTYFDK